MSKENAHEDVIEDFEDNLREAWNSAMIKLVKLGINPNDARHMLSDSMDEF